MEKYRYFLKAGYTVSSSIDGEQFNTSIHFVAVFPGI
jgi:hypothetical protein